MFYYNFVCLMIEYFVVHSLEISLELWKCNNFGLSYSHKKEEK